MSLTFTNFANFRRFGLLALGFGLWLTVNRNSIQVTWGAIS